jgi:hypothetical protein
MRTSNLEKSAKQETMKEEDTALNLSVCNKILMMLCAIMNQRELPIMLKAVLILLVGESPNSSLSSVVTIFMKKHI